MTYFSHISTCIAKSFTAKGRTSLVQYACLTSFQLLVCLVLAFFWFYPISIELETLSIISLAFLVLTFPAMLNATIRRFHDIGYSGWYVVPMVLIPVVVASSVLWLLDNALFFWLVLLVQIGFFGWIVPRTVFPLFTALAEDDNRYGPGPADAERAKEAGVTFGWIIGLICNALLYLLVIALDLLIIAIIGMSDIFMMMKEEAAF